MTDQPSIFVESDRLRAVGRLDIAVGSGRPGYEPSVTLDPTGPVLSLGGGEPPKGGELRLQDGSSTTRGLLSAADERGRLAIRDRNDRPSVTATADDSAPAHAISLFSAGSEATRLEHTTDGTRLVVFDAVGGDEAVSAAVDPPSVNGQSGRLVVYDRLGDPTCELLGRDGTLLLTGREEQTSDSDARARYGADAFGGGELVVQTNDTVDDAVRNATDVDDIHVHATGERDSEYGVAAANRPRVHLDGPEATVELGRGEIDAERPGLNGELDVLSAEGDVLLEAGTEQRLTNENGGTLVFRRAANGTPQHVGAIAAHEDGLMIRFSRDAASTDFPTALLITKRGEIKLSGTLDTSGV